MLIPTAYIVCTYMLYLMDSSQISGRSCADPSLLAPELHAHLCQVGKDAGGLQEPLVITHSREIVNPNSSQNADTPQGNGKLFSPQVAI